MRVLSSGVSACMTAGLLGLLAFSGTAQAGTVPADLFGTFSGTVGSDYTYNPFAGFAPDNYEVVSGTFDVETDGAFTFAITSAGHTATYSGSATGVFPSPGNLLIGDGGGMLNLFSSDSAFPYTTASYSLTNDSNIWLYGEGGTSFRVDVTGGAVDAPEPCVLSLFGLGVLSLLGVRYGRRGVPHLAA